MERTANYRPSVVPSSRRGLRPPVKRPNGGEIGLLGNRKVVSTLYADDSLHLSLPRTAPVYTGAAGVCARIPGKAGENDKCQVLGGSSPCTRPSE